MAPPLVGVRGLTDPTIESRVTIREDDLDQQVMKVMGEYTMDHGRRESPVAFSAGHPPPTDGPLIGVVSHPPPVPPNEVIFSCIAVHVVSLQAMLTLVFVFMLLNLTSIWKLPTF